jgi:trk system potassium uptake protein TrkH
MNLRLVMALLGRIVLFFTASAIPALVMACFEDATPKISAFHGFVALIAIGGVAGALLSAIGRGTGQQVYRRESLLVVALTWIFAGWLAAIPFIASGALPRAADGFFESVSGLTTCGATVLGSPLTAAIHELTPSLHFWRSFIQWMGGLGIILMFVVLLPAMGIAPWTLLESEQVGVSDPRVRPAMLKHGRQLLLTYVVLTLAQIALLWGVGGMSVFESLCHAMTTMPTGGYSTRDWSVAEFQSVAVELIIIAFMILAASNFMLLRDAIVGDHQGRLRLWRDPELRGFLRILGTGVLIASALMWLGGAQVADPATGGVRDYGNYFTCLRDAAFNLTSVMSCTGYGTANFQCWPVPVVGLVMLLMFIGGCTGSTSGGIKVIRALVVWRVCVNRLRAFVRPRSVELVRVEGQVFEAREVGSLLSIVAIFAIAVVLGSLLLALDPRLDMLSAVSSCVTSISCAGPGMTAVIQHGNEFQLANAGGIDVGPFGSFGLLHDASKYLLSLLMILGRLEFLALLVLVMPSFWRRR